MKKKGKFYTTGEVASFCHVSINAVKKWITTGKVDAFRTPGGHYRIREKDFRVFVSRFKLKLEEDIFPTKRRVLIVEDDSSIREYLKDAIDSMENGYLVETAADGYEALIKVGDFKPELLVLDLRMTRLDGFEVCRRLRTDKKTRNIKVMAITAYGREDRDRVIACGADFCLSKPLKLNEFRERVEILLA